MKKVIVGISGGVDSSVAAYLLKEKGYEVIGVTFLFTENNDINDAINVCKELNIKHYIIDYKKEFKNKIIDNFINDYKNGITPNPCVICNRDVKIKLLYEYMLKFECDFLATGHYAKIIDGNLYISEDLMKDQTYFLSQVPKNILKKMILPLENIKKEKVREIAGKLKLITSNKKDSIDVCFIKGSFKDFINQNVLSKNGKVINIENNEIIGEHKGLINYTIGQRRGLDIGGYADRMFVVGKNLEKNILYVAIGDENDYLYSDACKIKNINLINDIPDKCLAKFRYKSKMIEVNIEKYNDYIIVKYPSKAKAVTPGQACVFYKGDECLGSGIIEEIYKNNKKIWYI